MASARQALIILAKHPSSGATKTRLQPELSSQQIAGLYESFMLDILELAKSYEDTRVFLYVWPLSKLNNFKKYASEKITVLPQSGQNLGDRLKNCFKEILHEGFHKVVVISVDSPNLPEHIIPAAFKILDENEVVLGPSLDGGYYLIALKNFFPELFEDISWSTSRVLTQTTIKAVKMGLNVGLLPEWYDVDEYHDLIRLYDDLKKGSSIDQHIAMRTRDYLRNFFTKDDD